VIVALWRAGCGIREALAPAESDLDQTRGAVLMRRGKAANAAKLGWTAGHWRSSSHGSGSGPSCQSARCSACPADRHAGGHARPPASAPSFAMSRARPGSDPGSHRTNSAMRPKRKRRVGGRWFA
jgi:hypothetical protein